VVQVAGQLGAEKTAGDRREARGGLGGGGKQWEGRHGGARARYQAGRGEVRWGGMWARGRATGMCYGSVGSAELRCRNDVREEEEQNEWAVQDGESGAESAAN